MNRSLYRIVFNRSRGLRMAVAEIASGQGKGRSRSVASSAAVFAFSALALAAAANAQIKADAAAPGNQRPTVLAAPNGVPLVNIQTPSAAGVSRNTYSQFDVGRPGVILNNSRTNVQTQLGGYVQGNPWLAGGPAKVILNEVNSSNPSLLKGPVEVGGSKADVVIANPSGIKVDGTTFINASNVVLTTGKPVLGASGNLESYRVVKGTVVVEGLGLDTRTASYADIYARAVEINAGLWANYFRLVAGANDVPAADPTQPTPIAPPANIPKPRFALDIAAIGGMYARHIYLVGNEYGLGVNHQGAMAGGKLVLHANGWLTNTGEMQATGDLQVQAQGITNSGTVHAGGNGSLTATDGIANAGLIAAQGKLAVQAQQVSNIGGQIAANGGVSIHSGAAALTNTAGGQIASQSTVTLTGNGLNNQGGQVQSVGDLSVDAGVGAINNNSGLLRSNGTTQLTGSVITNSATSGPEQGIEGRNVTRTTTSDSARGSNIQAGGNVRIQATGAGDDSNVVVQGSRVTAGGTAELQADNKVQLLAARNTASQASKDKSNSASIGISIGTSGFGVTAAGSQARGNADGNDVNWTNTHVQANNVNIQSGGDTDIKGAVVTGGRVRAQIGGNLNIESLQDTSTYRESSKSAGGSLTVGAGVSGSVSASRSNIDSRYASVTEQSGIRAGDGGFQVDVQGKTVLKGGAITSTQKAVDDGKNHFESAGGVTTSDIQNSASYSAKGVGINIGTGTSLDGKLTPQGNSAGVGKDSGSANSTTQAAISGITGNKEARTGDAQTGIKQIFDQQKVKDEINAQVAITAEFGRKAPKAWADYAESKVADLKKDIDAARQTGDTAQAQSLTSEAKKWDEGGEYRIAGHTILGTLSGNASGAAGAITSAAVMPQIAASIDSIDLPDAVKQGLGMVASATLGGLVGGTAGAATAFNVEANNRQLHPTEIQWIKSNAKRYAELKGISEASAEKLLAEQAFRQVQFGAEGGIASWDVDAQNFLKTAGTQALPEGGFLFYAPPEQRANATMYLQSAVQNAAFYTKNGLTQPTVADLQAAAARDARIRENIGSATKTAFAASATIALAGMPPTLLDWALANPIPEGLFKNHERSGSV